MASPKLTLFDHPVSSYAQKVRIALREKNIPFERIAAINLTGGGPNPVFIKANPRGEVPVLLVNDGAQAIVDSRVICEYLEDAYPDTAIYPQDAIGRAKARMIEQVCDAQYEAVNWGWGEVQWMGRAEGALRDHLKAEAARQTSELQQWLEERLTPSGWLTGECFGIADAAAGPIVHRSAYFGFPPVAGSKLAEWLDRVRAWPSAKATLQEFDENVGRMAQHRETFLSGRVKREYRDYRLEFLVKSGAIDVVTAGLKSNNIRFPWPEGNQQ